VVGNFDRAAAVACGRVIDSPNGRVVLATLKELTGR